MYKVGRICENLSVAVFCENNRNVLNEVFHTGKEPFQCSECYYLFYQLREPGYTVDINSFCLKKSYSKYDAHCEFQIIIFIRKNLFLFFECEFFTSERDIEHLDKTWSS